MARSHRYFDPSQPQTLQIATLLLYLEAALLVLRGAVLSPIGLPLTAACAGGAFGIANGKHWGYGLGLVVAVLRLILPFLFGATLTSLLRYQTIEFMFAIALMALLVHPRSREYQRIWFN